MAALPGPWSRVAWPLWEQLYQLAFRKKLYPELDELQADLDAWILTYNE